MRGRWSGLHPGGYLDGGRKPTSLHVVARDLIGRVTATWSGVVYRKRAGRAKHSLGYACILCLDQCCGTVYFLVGSGSRLSLKNIITEIDVKSQRSASRCPIFFAFPFLAPAKKARLRADLHCRKSWKGIALSIHVFIMFIRRTFLISINILEDTF